MVKFGPIGSVITIATIPAATTARMVADATADTNTMNRSTPKLPGPPPRNLASKDTGATTLADHWTGLGRKQGTGAEPDDGPHAEPDDGPHAEEDADRHSRARDQQQHSLEDLYPDRGKPSVPAKSGAAPTTVRNTANPRSRSVLTARSKRPQRAASS
ncbi:hypothetical protein [Pseudonocardia sp. NPDC049154]|uniref:hypothetical protein n=1 Tax=Pseudonocardia sp. NPDC049154 TaxID=3155501 RepID=UPI0033D86CFF